MFGFCSGKRKKYRILAIDGGGMKGIFTAYALWKLEEEYGISVIDYFDMIVGTSTGALIAVGVLSRTSGKEIYNSYMDDDRKVFDNKKGIREQLSSMFFAKYNSASLEYSIKETFGQKRLSDLYKMSGNKDFAIFSSNFTRANGIIYGSPNMKVNPMLAGNKTIFEALRSSTAAPFFFEPLEDAKTKDLLLDGGLWANNPALFAVLLAQSEFDIDIDSCEVLSFGQSFTNGMEIKLVHGKELLKNPLKNQLSLLLTSSLILSLNTQTKMLEGWLGDRTYRYSPELPQRNVSVSAVDKKFINYTKIYWEENKETLVDFIKTGKNKKV